MHRNRASSEWCHDQRQTRQLLHCSYWTHQRKIWRLTRDATRPVRSGRGSHAGCLGTSLSGVSL